MTGCLLPPGNGFRTKPGPQSVAERTAVHAVRLWGGRQRNAFGLPASIWIFEEGLAAVATVMAAATGGSQFRSCFISCACFAFGYHAVKTEAHSRIHDFNNSFYGEYYHQTGLLSRRQLPD